MTATVPTTTSPSPTGFIAALALTAALGLGAGFALNELTGSNAPATTAGQPPAVTSVDTAPSSVAGSVMWARTDVPESRFIISFEPQLE
ncbi:MAG TPA: hypothetical protein VLA76_05360 [Candidatus Angelobacter sp.]|nr:hypothetical protein [Candidatus Angelobacter sp.]